MDAPLKVLHVSFTLDTGGLERIILDLMLRGPGLGLAPAAAVLGEPGSLAARAGELGFVVHRLEQRPGLDWEVVRRLRELVRRLGVSVLHAHNEGAGLYAGLAGRLSGRPVVTTRHGLSFRAGPRGIWLRRAAGLLARRTVCVGRGVYRLARRVDRLPARRLEVVYNGVDTRRFAPDPAARARARGRLGLGPAEPVVISVGRLAPEKDYGVLLEAMARLPRPEARLLLVGEGPARPGLEAMIGELGLAGRVRLLGDRRDVPSLLNAADVFALSSLSEGVSMALLEAMACGLPAVATRVGGTPEVVRQGETGLLCPPGQPRPLAQALERLLARPGLARALGEAGRERVGQRFSLGAMARAYARIYAELAGRGGEAGR
jgi:glycosyltransferase involved in cell wall biosynthesis